MTEAEARDLLRNCDWPSDDGVEAWLADQPWQAVPGGWTLVGERQGWRFKVETIPGGLRISAGEPGATPAAWEILPR